MKFKGRLEMQYPISYILQIVYLHIIQIVQNFLFRISCIRSPKSIFWKTIITQENLMVVDEYNVIYKLSRTIYFEFICSTPQIYILKCIKLSNHCFYKLHI